MTQLGVVYKPGDVVTATYNFRKDKNEDLAFNRNEELRILNISKDPNWAHARNAQGETGLIPLNYVQPADSQVQNLKFQPWFHDQLSRTESELLLSGLPPGNFLIRNSDAFSGDLTLCVVGPPADSSPTHVNRKSPDDRHPASSDPLSPDPPPTTNIQHYHIICKHLPLQNFSPSTRLRFSLDEIDWFPDLQELVQFYSLPDSGLVTALTTPIPDFHRQRLERLKEHGWLIPHSALTLGDPIGHGEFGEVSKATYKNVQVAVKMYKPAAYKQSVTYEAALMSKLDHSNLVSFIGLVYEPDLEMFYLVTEYLAHGDLLTYLHSRTRDEITDQTKLQFGLQSCCGLAYLEERGIVHRDVAARNILLSGNPPHLRAKVSDFGMARHVNSPSPTTSTTNSPLPDLSWDPPLLRATLSRLSSASAGVDAQVTSIQHLTLHDNTAIPIKWTAPEAVRKRLFTSKSDVWSFGILLWEIFSYGRIPYPRMMANQAIRQVLSGYRMRAPDDCPPEVYRIMRRTWHIDPTERPSFATLMQELTRLYKHSFKSAMLQNKHQLNVFAQIPSRDLPSEPLTIPNFGNRRSFPERRSSLSSTDGYASLDDFAHESPSTIPRSFPTMCPSSRPVALRR